jgi:rare lipoprotein A
LLAVTGAHAKEPGARYCFHGLCYRVGTIAQTDTLVGWRGYVLASYYDDCRRDRLNPCGLTSSGAVFRPDLPDNAASPLLPDGTIILAYNPKTGDASVLRITNAGPYSGKRKLDVSRAAADGLGFKKQGVAPLVISVLYSPTKAEASYVRRRAYPDVPGPLGKFPSFDAAYEAALQRLDAEQASEALASAVSFGVETGSLGGEVPEVPRPRLAVSPSLARELVMLRTPPRPVSRVRLLVEGPRLVRRGTLAVARPIAPWLARMDFAPGLRGVVEADGRGAQ